MAFLFSGSSTAAGGEEQKQDIFGGGSAPGAQGEGPAKTDVFQTASADGGSVSRGISGGAAPAQGSAPQPAQAGYNPKAIQSAYAQIGQRIHLPTRAIGDAKSSIQAGQQKLQNAANQYAQAGQQQAESFKLDDDTLQKAASGDRDAYQKTAERLTSQAPQVKAFEGLANDDLPVLSDIRDNTKAYSKEAGPNYTSGQARFDAGLLRRNPEYARIQQQLLGEESSLKKQNTEMMDSETARQKQMLEESHKNATGDIRNRLGGLSQQVMNDLKAKESAEDTRRASLDTTTIAKQEYAKLKTKIQQDLKTADPRSQQYRAAVYLDSLSPDQLVGQFINVDRDTDWREFVDQGTADRYNRIEGLLGNGGMLTPHLQGAGSDYVLDEGNAYRSIMEEITGRRARADEQSKAEMDRIIAAARERSTGYNTRDSQTDARSQAMNELVNYARTKYGQNPDLQLSAEQLARGLFDYPVNEPRLQELIRDNSGSDWSSVLLGTEAQRLNELERDLGGMNAYTEGNYRDEIDMRGLQELFEQVYGPHLGQYYQNQVAAAKPKPASNATGSAGRPNHQR